MIETAVPTTRAKMEESVAAKRVALGPDGEPTSGYRWIIVLFTWGAFLLTAMDRLAWGPVAVTAGATLGMSVAALGVFASAFYISYVVSNAIGGYFIDWLGGRLMVTFALVPLGVATLLFGTFTTSIRTGMIFQALMGLAAGMDFAACIKLIASWFGPRTRGRAMGLFLTGSSLAVVLTNAVVPTCMKIFGWGGAYRVLGIVTTIFGASCYFVLRNGPLQAPAKSGAKPQVGRLFRNPSLLFLSVAGFGAYWGTWGFAAWANALMIKGHHLSPVRAGFIVAVFGVGAIVGKPLIGLISDWLGGTYKRLSIGCFVSFAVMLLIFGRMDTETGFLIAAPFLGITAFLYTPLMAAGVTQQAGVGLAGSATGLTSALWQLGSTIVPITVGVVFQSTRSFNAAFMVLAAGPALAALSMFFVRELKPSK